ncbi:hypothetical protein HYC85_006974 [Camellia sinensis]|uniref:NB-ARC domain-containing protein n=1 Tax=Camellia sinensis TaxID=4442 RepID=A0A7J7HQ48_CAMSI|nr:hypothetical protein HYC85_006974 [Camellia sinensis]
MELRFLIVLDDICTNDDWLKFVRPFADAVNGSRVIITTRDSKVASEVDPWSHPLNLMQLTEEDTWALFLNKAVPENSSENNLNNVKAEIVSLCRGLPMAIVLLGGLLSTVELSEWSIVIDHLLARDHHFLKCIVDLSYEKLPSRLKLCFLYLVMFPKSYEISTRRLLQLWVAEGFVQTSNEPSIDSQDMAMTCLKELERRNMIEITERKSDESPKTCQGVYKPSLPEKLGQYLKNLRYIGLRWTGLHTFPESIGDLQCLETLDLKYTNITTLPSSIWKAKSLRHLYMTGASIQKPSSKESSTSTS